MERMRPTEPTPPSLPGMVERARSEYLEMPGLNLTAPQAQRLWALDATFCDAVLSALLEARFLKRTAANTYLRNDATN